MRENTEKRAVISFFVMTVFFMTCVLRLAVIATGEFAEMQLSQSSYRISVSKPRGTIYDCNMYPITNAEKRTVAAVMPTPRAITGISSLINSYRFSEISETLSKGKPVVVTTEKKADIDGITFYDDYVHTTKDTFAEHIIGYIDDSGHGVSGIEMAYDELLYSDETLDAVFEINGKGEVLEGVYPYFDFDGSVFENAVVTTLDLDIQNIAENASIDMKKGAVIVADCKTSKIRAMVSKPSFDITDLGNSLEDSNSPLINRAMLAFSVGSVFKPVVAGAAIEKGKDDFEFTCEGRTFIVDRYFNCHKLSGHGALDLQGALAFSCNCFFYNFAEFAGADPIYNFASALNFGNSVKIGKNLETAKGSITEKSLLKNPATLANFSIGQGDVALSPIAMLNLYSAIANDGSYYIPSVIEATIEKGKRNPYDIGSPTRVMSKETADKLKVYLRSVVTIGTGMGAEAYNCEVAGKTATAQTGRFDDSKKEITNGWFCGFFPAENPKYTVIVMAEGADNPSSAEICGKIAEKITEFEENT